MQKGNALKVLDILHKGLLMGQVLFAAACVYLVYSKRLLPSAADLEKILQVIALIMTAAGIYAGTTIFKKKILMIRETQADAMQKFSEYRAASIFQWALLEGPSIFCIICFFLTGNYAFLALSVVIMFLFATVSPSKNKVLAHLQITEAELDEL
ncbi:MAG TPA: hypothetical protein VHL77_03920 [Ferruginibacter sp.]|jgi:hypothetical protein|nr:hypothetical protein [Ferruginibacter sp.]